MSRQMSKCISRVPTWCRPEIVKETRGSVNCAQPRAESSQISLFLGGNVPTTRARLKGVLMVTVTRQLLEQGLSRNGALNARQVNALGDNITVSGWRWRIMGKYITEQQKTRFLELKDAHLPKIQPCFAGFE